MAIKLLFSIGALLLAEFLITSVRAQEDDFTKARFAVVAAAPNINYTSFCSKIESGEDKIACRIQTVPTIGFLVCKQPTLDDIPCSDILTEETNQILEVLYEGVRTVLVDWILIHDVKCGVADSLNCSGFLEMWVTNGEFQQIRDHIVDSTVEDLINQVKNFTEKNGWPLTVNDLNAIIKYMNVNPNQSNYRQICDLQGFFLQAGGFVVSDVPFVAKNIALNQSCYDDDREPTTQQVLMTLESIVKALSTDEVFTTMPADSGKQNSAMITLSVVLYLGILTLT